MDANSVSIKLVDDGKGCSLVLRRDDELIGSLVLDAASLDGLLHSLSMQRAAMAEEVPRKLPNRSKAAVSSQPEWQVPEDPAPNARLLLLRHSGFGWLAFHMTTKRAMSLATELGRVSGANV